MAQKPNIIFFLTDDLGYGDVSCMNPESKIRTENIDRLATQGMRFTDCHSSCRLLPLPLRPAHRPLQLAV